MGKEPIPNIPLPQGWQPGPLDVVICKGKRFRHHAGNQRLRQICETRLADYQNASKMQKSVIITEVVDVVRKQGGKWVKPSEGAQAAIVGDVDDINWVLAEDLLCREKSGASFRDVMRSSSKTTSSSTYTRQGSAPNLMLSSSSSIKNAGSAKDLLESLKMAKIGSNSDIQRCLSAGTLMLSKRPSSGQFSQAKKASFSKLQDANCKNNITQGGGSKNATWSTTTSGKARSKSPNPLLARSMMAGFRSNSNKNLMENVRSNSQRNLMANGRSGSQRNLMANGRSGSQRNLMANGRSGSQRNLMANGRSNSRRNLQLSPANSQRDLMAGFRSHMGRMLPNNNNPQPPPPQVQVQAQPQAQASPTLVNLQSQIDQMQQQLQKLQQSNLGIGPTTTSTTTTQARPLDQFQSQLNQMQQQLQNHPTGPTISTTSTTADPVKLLPPVDPVKSHHEDSDSHFSLEGIDFGGKEDPLMDFSIQSVESANHNASVEHLQQAELILQQAAHQEQQQQQVQEHQHDSEEFCLPGIDLDEGVPTTTTSSNPMAAW